MSLRLTACLLVGMAVGPRAGSAQTVVERYQAACEENDLGACVILGIMYERGAGVDADPETARALFARACNGGQIQGCDLARSAGASASAAGMPVAVRVVDDETGAPLADAIVEVASRGVRALSGPSGRADLGRLPEGSHDVMARRFGHEPVPGRLTVPLEGEVVIRMPRASGQDPRLPGRIVGRVVDRGAGASVPNVDVSVVGGSARTLSDARGGFTLNGVPPGLVHVEFAHLAYETNSAPVVVQPGESVEMTVMLSTEAIELEPLSVTVAAPANTLDRAGFYSRARRGFGTHFSSEQIAQLQPFTTSDLLRRAPGVRLVWERGAWVPESIRGSGGFRGRCRLPILVDGVPGILEDIDQIPPEWLDAVEVYNGISTPMQFGNSCGAIVIWTRR